MRIIIDTSKDSNKDIKKVIKFLQDYIGNIEETSSVNDAEPGMFNMFDNDKDEEPHNLKRETQDSAESLLNDDSDDEDISILPY